MTNQETSQPDEHRSQGTEGFGGIVRRVLSRDPSAEERLEQILTERRRELAEQAAIVEQTLGDLERREEQLRDSKSAIERLLRLGQRDLDLRESDLVRHGRELDDREARLEREAAEVARRRAELGAVELKRAALEQRDRALAAREAELDARQPTAPEPGTGEPLADTPAGQASTLLLFVPGPSYRLVEIVREPVSAGDEVEVEGIGYRVARIGPSPLPSDGRRCVYLVRGGPERRASGGSS
jgi:hypothetical protein